MAIAPVQSVAGAIINDYGLDNIPFTLTNPASAASTASQNILIAYVTWNVAYFTYQSTGKSPAVNVTDSAGNLWRQIGSTGQNAGSRAAIWACINARQVSWVSVALTGWAYSTSYVVTEFGGLPSTMQAISLDFEQDTSATSAVATLACPSAVVQTTDFVVGLAGVGTNASAFSTPAGWTKITTTAGGSAQYDSIVQPYFIASQAAGTLAFTPTWTTAGPASVITAGLQLTAAAPVQPRATFPRVVVESCFAAQPGDWTQAVDYTYTAEGLAWTDITTRCIGDDTQERITVSRGRQYELTQEETGEMTVILDNHDGAFSIGNVASPFYSNALNANMSFQNTASPWTAQNSATIAVTGAQAYASGYAATAYSSLLITPSGVNAQPGAVSEKIAINPNFTYSASVTWFSATVYATGVETNVSWYTSGGTLISTSSVSATSLPAAAWTQVKNTNLTPPATAAFAQIVAQVQGTPSSAHTFNIAEGMLVAGTPGVFLTGLMTPGTPLRVTAWWQQPGGIPLQYPIGYGYVERWPQDWPDMPQWGFTEVSATDAYGPMSSTDLASAVGGDIRKDYPYAYFPTNEQYSFTSQSLDPIKAPIDANGLIAINQAFGNNRYGAYRDGAGAGVETGQALNLMGSQDTVVGASSYSAQDTNDNGPAMFYVDPNLPVNGASGTGSFSFEFWFVWGNGTNFSCTLLNVFGPPSTYFNTSLSPPVNGCVITVGINTQATGLYVNDQLVAGITGTPPLVDVNLFNPQHFAMTVGPDATTCFLNGTVAAVFGTNVLVGNIPKLRAYVLGPGRFSYDSSLNAVYNSYNFAAGHLAIYNQELTPTMIANHYKAGISGWAGVSAPYRFAQSLTWGLLGLKRGGVMWAGSHGTSQNTLIGEAYDVEGSNAADIANQLTTTEGGRCYTQGNGSVIYVPRWSLYNSSAVASFGDNGTTEIPYLQETSFTVDNSFINNQISATQNRGPNQDIFFQQTNSASQLNFFNRSSLSLQSYAVSPFDVYGNVNWQMTKYNFPIQRVDHIAINPASVQGALPATFGQVLSLELEQSVIINRRPVSAGTAATISVNGAIQRLQHAIGANVWTTQLQATPRFPESNVLTADQSGWAFTATGTPTLLSYFIVTTAQSASVNVGDKFTDVTNSGTTFTVTGKSTPFGGFVNVSFIPNANAAMNSGDVVTQVPYNTLGNSYLAW